MKKKNPQEFTSQLTFFKTFTLYIPDAIVWGYLAIMLYKQTNSLALLFVERLIFVLGIYAGFVVISFFLDKIGYLITYRLSLLMNLLAIFFLLVFRNNLEYTFAIISIMHGLSRGIYWPVEHTVNTRNISGKQRSSLINKLTALNLIIIITLPVLAGLLIESRGEYDLLLLIALCTNLFALFIPFKNNFKEITNLRTSEIRKLVRKKVFKRFAFTQSLLGSFQTLHTSVFLIVPFLFLQSELGVGLLVSSMGLIAAFTSFAERNIPDKHKVVFGYISHILWASASFLLVIFWNPVILVIQSVLNAFNIALGLSIRANEDYKIRENILGDDLKESSAEMNLIVETIYLFSRVFVFGLLLIVISSNIESLDTFLRIIIPISPVLMLLGYHLIVRQAR